jgi:hypothetical protein
MMTIALHFQGPYPLCSESEDVLTGCPCLHSPGLYFWTVEMPTGTQRVSYIGETSTSFYQRTKEHIIQKLGGMYRICDPRAMAEGRAEILWDGLWRRGTREKLPDFLQRYESLAPQIKASLLLQKIFVAPLECDRRLRQRIEGALAKAIRSTPEAASLLPSDVRYYSGTSSEGAVSVLVTSDRSIEGIPDQIAA